MSSTAPLNRPEPLLATHKAAGFDCGIPELDTYLIRHAWNNHQAGSARTFVCTEGDVIVGYYSLAAAQIIHAEAAVRLKKGLAAHPIPVVLLARLAVIKRWQGRKLGLALLKDAILRSVQASDTIGIRALIVHAKDDKARAFYQKFGFEPLPEHPLHLFLLLKDARKQLPPH